MPIPDTGSARTDVGVRPTEEGAAEDAEIASRPAAETPMETVSMPAADDEGYVWPEGAESAPVISEPAAAPAVAKAPLPKLDELVARIPGEVRETLDELFRAKFTSVKRVSPASLK